MPEWYELAAKGDKGDTGPSGADGRTPIHVSEDEPTVDVLIGDTWFKPSTTTFKVCTSGT